MQNLYQIITFQKQNSPFITQVQLWLRMTVSCKNWQKPVSFVGFLGNIGTKEFTCLLQFCMKMHTKLASKFKGAKTGKNLCLPYRLSAGLRHLGRYPKKPAKDKGFCQFLQLLMSILMVKHSTYGSHSFAVSGPCVWNVLPSGLSAKSDSLLTLFLNST